MKKVTAHQIKTFKNYLEDEEKSHNTIEKYLRDILNFISWAEEREITKQLTVEYKNYLKEKFAPASVNSKLSSLNSFFEFCGEERLKIKLIKMQQQIFLRKEKELTRGEYERLLIAAKRKDNKRLYYLMQTICSTGIRVSELRFITVESLKERRAHINCKGKLRIVILPDKLCKMLKEYIREKKIMSGPVFVTKNGKPLDRSNICNDMKKLCDSAGVPREKVFPHNLRHPYVKLKLKILFGLYRSLQSAEILHFPYNLNPFAGIHIHFINEPVSQAL